MPGCIQNRDRSPMHMQIGTIKKLQDVCLSVQIIVNPPHTHHCLSSYLSSSSLPLISNTQRRLSTFLPLPYVSNEYTQVNHLPYCAYHLIHFDPIQAGTLCPLGPHHLTPHPLHRLPGPWESEGEREAATKAISLPGANTSFHHCCCHSHRTLASLERPDQELGLLLLPLRLLQCLLVKKDFLAGMPEQMEIPSLEPPPPTHPHSLQMYHFVAMVVE